MTVDHKVDGVVLMLIDIDLIRKREQEIKDEADALGRLNHADSRLWQCRSLREGLDEMLAAMMDLLGADMGNVQIMDAGRPALMLAAQRGFGAEFLEHFREVTAEGPSACSRALRGAERVIIEDVNADPAYAPLRVMAQAAGYRAVQSTPLMSRDGAVLGMISTHFRTPHGFGEQTLQRLDLYARKAADFIERCGTDEAVTRLNHSLAEQTRAVREREERLQVTLDTIADAVVTIDQQGIIRSINAGTERMFGYRADELIGQNVKMLMPAPYRDEHDGYLERYRRTGERHMIGIGREVQGRRKDGSLFPLDLMVSEFEFGGEKRCAGVLRDLTDRKTLERQVLEVATLEQQRIGQELHDTAAQDLTALGMLARTLEEALKAGPVADLNIATKLADGVKKVLSRVRAVCRGLIRVEVDAQGLMVALQDLAAQTAELSGVNCICECEEPVQIADNQTATQLHYIAREAVTNALKHAQAQNISIRLQDEGGSVTLSVEDDGVGIPEPLPDTAGLGLKIMRYRAGLINAHLSISRGDGRGTVVTCTCSKGLALA
jgi:PAS domain S-box-containing protein